MGLLSWFGIAIVCGAAVKAPRELSIVETLQATPDLSQFVDALVRTRLVDALAGPGPVRLPLSGEAVGPFTVFAPTNDAFEAISSVMAGLTPRQLVEVLEYHVIAGVAAKSTELSDMQVLLPLLTQNCDGVCHFDKSLHVHILKNGDIRIVGEKNLVTVTTADVVCSNGVVHIVNAVLDPNVTPARSVGEVIETIADLSTLGHAWLITEVAHSLAPGGPFTMFAPTNAAFAAIGVPDITTAWFSEKNAPFREWLTQVLKYHIVAGVAAKASDLSNMQVLQPLFSNHSLSVDLEDLPTVRIVGEMSVATVTTADVVCADGVVHIVDAVLVPNVTPAVLVPNLASFISV